MNEKIADYLPETEILAQLAEEASELAQAALKLRRALDGTNPTPKSVRECRKALVEEIADMRVCLQELPLTSAERMATYQIADKKLARWVKRLLEKVRDGKQETDGFSAWISVKDALPEKDGDHIVTDKDGDVFIMSFNAHEKSFGSWGGHYDGDTYVIDSWGEYPVTHWLPLPEVPEEYR